MKKLCLGIVALFASMIWISNVSALDRIQNFVDGESDDIEGKKIEENVYELKIKDEPGDLQDDIVIEQGETVTLDLNGKKLTNFTPGCSVIWVKDTERVEN